MSSGYYTARRVLTERIWTTGYVVSVKLSVGRIMGGHMASRRVDRHMGKLSDYVYEKRVELESEMYDLYEEIKSKSIVCNEEYCCCCKAILA